MTNVGSEFRLTKTSVRFIMRIKSERVFEERVFLVEKAKNYVFMLILAGMIILAAFYFTFSGAEGPSYSEIKVAKGDSLWSLAEEYKTFHNMDEIEFIKWVQDENDLITTKILPGEQLIIPVPSVKNNGGLQLADGD